MSKKVCLLGTAQRSLYDAYYDDPEWEVWATGTCATFFKKIERNELLEKVDLYFELHKTITETHAVYDEFLKDYADKVVDAEKYPMQEVIAFFSEDNYCSPEAVNTFNYFTSTISWMLALAIMEGYEEIALFGIDMANSSEYASQRPSVEYFIGQARGRGIKVIIPFNCDMLKIGTMYGLEDSYMPEVYSTKYKELTRKLQEIEQDIVKFLISGGNIVDSGTNQRISGWQLLQNKLFLQGAVDVARYYAEQWGHEYDIAGNAQ